MAAVLLSGTAHLGTDGRVDEVVYACVREALARAGVRKQDVDLSIVASRDLYDGCSMSNGQTLPAAGGWMAGSVTRLETDASAALVLADAVLRCGDAEVAVVAGVHQPQAPRDHAFGAQVSNLAAEPVYERPSGMTATSLLAMQAARLVADGTTTQGALAETAAREITAGAGTAYATRDQASVDDVLAADAVAWPLTELMLPAETAGVVALVLATPERARALGGGRARLIAHGMSANGALGGGDWLVAPCGASTRAAADAYRRTGITDPAAYFDVAEVTAASPALCEPLRDALGLRALPDARICPSGGARSSFPGVANGALRLLAAVEWLEDNGGSRALVHSTDTLAGPVSATTTVTILERVA